MSIDSLCSPFGLPEAVFLRCAPILSKDLLAAHDFANPETAILRPGALLADGAARLRLGTAAARHPYHGERARHAGQLARIEKRVDDFPIRRIPADEEEFFAQVLGLVLGLGILFPSD